MPVFIMTPARNTPLASLLLVLACLLPAATLSAATPSKRIEVYSLDQPYYDTRYGDTLSEILWQLLPNQPGKRAALQQAIIQRNPQAFINGNPNRLLAGKRLYLPGYQPRLTRTPAKPTGSKAVTVEHYSWGSIKRPKNTGSH